jgi:hypothetical protein
MLVSRPPDLVTGPAVCSEPLVLKISDPRPHLQELANRDAGVALAEQLRQTAARCHRRRGRDEWIDQRRHQVVEG